jgi:hypothetical protein
VITQTGLAPTMPHINMAPLFTILGELIIQSNSLGINVKVGIHGWDTIGLS